MTAPVCRFTRLSTDVEALYLGHIGDLQRAEAWMGRRGTPAARRHPALAADGLLVPTGPRAYVTATVGQWLVLDLASGRWSVADDDRGVPAGHRRSEGAA